MNSFRIIYLDDDNKTFSISMPMVDDTNVNKKTCDLQQTGRNVRICTSDTNVGVDEILKYYGERGYQFDKNTGW